MSLQKEDGMIREISCGDNFEYVLEDERAFLNTEYKVLQSRTDGIFIPCMKIMRNGKISLYYIRDNYVSFLSMIEDMDQDMFISMILHLFSNLIEIRNNGFLSCQNVDFSWDKIFVDKSTMKIKLVYIPLNTKCYGSYGEFEAELRSQIILLISKKFSMLSEKTERFVQELSNGGITIDDIYNHSKNIAISFSGGSVSSGRQQLHTSSVSYETESLKIRAINAPEAFESEIRGEQILIGKKREIVDIAVTFNNMISRKHCRISKIEGSYYISDENSVNGTFVNHVRLRPGEKCVLKKGDLVRLANSDFQII